MVRDPKQVFGGIVFVSLPAWVIIIPDRRNGGLLGPDLLDASKRPRIMLMGLSTEAVADSVLDGGVTNLSVRNDNDDEETSSFCNGFESGFDCQCQYCFESAAG